MKLFSKIYSLPSTLQIVSDICLIDPDDQVMFGALIIKLHHSETEHIVYFRTSHQEKMEPNQYWETIINWIRHFCNDVKISWNVNYDGDLVFGKSIIKLIDGNTCQYVNAETREMTSVPKGILVDTTLLCGPEGTSSIKTKNKIIYVGDLDWKDPDRPKTLRVNSSAVADTNMHYLLRRCGIVTNLPSSISRVTPSSGDYSNIIKDLGAKQCLMFLFSRGPPFFECNKVLMQRCFPNASYDDAKKLNESIKKLDRKTRKKISEWEWAVNDNNFSYLLRLACVLVGTWPYKQEQIQDPSFDWGLCWSPADPNGLSKTLKEELITDPIQMVDNLNQKAAEIFGPGNALSPTYYDLYGLFMAMGVPCDSDTFQHHSIEFANFTKSVQKLPVISKRSIGTSTENDTNDWNVIFKISFVIIIVIHLYDVFLK